MCLNIPVQYFIKILVYKSFKSVTSREIYEQCSVSFISKISEILITSTMSKV